MTPAPAWRCKDSDTGIDVVDAVRFTGETTKGFKDTLLIPAARDGVKGVFASERVRWRRDGVLGWVNMLKARGRIFELYALVTWIHLSLLGPGTRNLRAMSLLFKHLRVHQVFGANTDVGKTILTCALLRASTKDVFYLKPISTGNIDDADDKSVHFFASIFTDIYLPWINVSTGISSAMLAGKSPQSVSIASMSQLALILSHKSRPHPISRS